MTKYFNSILAEISGLMCYWCSGVGNDRDCERKPLGIKSGPSNVNCSSKFCTTAKVMDLGMYNTEDSTWCVNVARNANPYIDETINVGL